MSISERLLYVAIRRRVFEHLGSFKNDLLTKELSEEEKKEAAVAVLDMEERACKEFFEEMRARLAKKH